MADYNDVRMEAIAGRNTEIQIMQQLLKNNKSDFLAVYGRRRIGKTFLIRNVFEQQMVFQLTGMANTSMQTQLLNFWQAIQKLEPSAKPVNSWFEAFEQLKKYLQLKKIKKKVVFFDELPWLDTPKSDFLSCLEHFWNSWASARKDIVLVVCGSAASWMINKLINNTGGLHNRVTKRILLEPFTLSETAHYFTLRNIALNPYQITQLYMVLGGVPYYLNEVEQGLSAAQIIDKLCFAKQGLLKDEYENLFRSLFSTSQNHSAVVLALSSKKMGLTRKEIVELSGLNNGGSLTTVLNELAMCGFIKHEIPFGKKQRDSLFRLSDFYTLFYLKFIKKAKNSGAGTWLSLSNTAAWHAWSGYAFENICIAHAAQIKQALGISGVYTQQAAWRSASNENGAQIDLLIDRKDDTITICEMKFSEAPFTFTKKYASELQNKMQVFKTESKTRKNIQLAMVSTYGVPLNTHALGLVQKQVLMDDLFVEVKA